MPIDELLDKAELLLWITYIATVSFTLYYLYINRII